MFGRTTIAICLLALPLLYGCADPANDPVTTQDPTETGGKADSFAAPELELLFEEDLEDILEHPDSKRFEASGVAALDDRFYVVFDNHRSFVAIDDTLTSHTWLSADDDFGIEDDPSVDDPDDFTGFEGIGVDREAGELALAIEAMRHESGDIQPMIAYWSGHEAGHEWIDKDLLAINSGIEGMAYIQVDGVKYLAALCETGKCDIRTRGRLLLVDPEGEVTKLDLPKGMDFADYSGLAVRGDRLAVVSQTSSRLWIGRVVVDEDGLETKTEGFWDFPRQRDGDIEYCTIEGVDFLDDETLVFVSDLEKHGQPDRCSKKAESIHIFALP